MKTCTVLVTGANGFVGSAVVAQLAQAGHRVRAAVRRDAPMLQPYAKVLQVGELTPETHWAEYLRGVEVVVHCAARVHVMRETTADPLAAFRLVNVASTLHLAQQAAAAGTRRFVFISSIGVNGAQTFEKPFRHDDVPAPHSPYAQSKFEAEQALKELGRQGPMEVVIIRPPLVFGPGAPGNFEQLMRALHRGLPLPLGAIHNQRSLVALDNLCDLIHCCLDHPAAPGQTFLVSDDEDVSTTELLRRTGLALGRRARLWPVPAIGISAVARCLGRKELAQRLVGSLQVDIRHTCQTLNWKPPVRMSDALDRTAKHFLQQMAAT